MAASPQPDARPAPSAPPTPPTPPGSPSRVVALGRTGWVLLIAACAAPHAVRWMLPHVAATDGAFAHSAFMISRGYSPYVQFAHVAFPFAEQALALVLNLFGHHVRVVEAFNLLNRFDWGNPITNYDLGTFGKITSLGADPRIMQFAVKFSY